MTVRRIRWHLSVFKCKKLKIEDFSVEVWAVPSRWRIGSLNLVIWIKQNCDGAVLDLGEGSSQAHWAR